MNPGGDIAVEQNFVYPNEWNDDERMSVMFAPFRDKTNYPKSWEQKMKFWIDLILQRCKACDELVIDAKSLSHQFMRKGKIPSGLDIVLDEMLRNGKLCTVTDVENQNESGWLSWGYNTFVKSPFTWGINKLLAKSAVHQGPLVPVELLKDKGRQLLERHQREVECSLIDNVIEVKVLKHRCTDLCPDEVFQLVLRQLEKDKKVIVAQMDNGDTIVKFAGKNESHVNPVRDIESKVYRIQKASEILEKEADLLHDSIARFTEEARGCVRKGLKTSAVGCLRKRKKAQKLLDKKLSTLDILHGLIQNIRDTVSEKMVLEAYESATSTLKNYMKTNNMTLDRVDDVMDNLQEVMQDQDEINTTMSTFKTCSWDTTQDDLETELDLILADDSPVKPAQTSERDEEFDKLAEPQFPDVPKSLPESLFPEVPKSPFSPTRVADSSLSPKTVNRSPKYSSGAQWMESSPGTRQSEKPSAPSRKEEPMNIS